MQCYRMPKNVKCFLLTISSYNYFYVFTICSFSRCRGELARVYFESRAFALFSLCSMWRWTCALRPRRVVVPCSMRGLPASVASACSSKGSWSCISRAWGWCWSSLVVCYRGLFMAATSVSMLSCNYWFLCGAVWRSRGGARVRSCRCHEGFGATWVIVDCFLEDLCMVWSFIRGWRSLSCTCPSLVAELLLFHERRLMVVRTPVEHVWC
jgi:hypothetical protein